MTESIDAALRTRIAKMLANGPQAENRPLPGTDQDIAKLRAELQALPPDDLDGKVATSGLADHPYGPERRRCRECMYFLSHREWCDLPELRVPVEADWHCLLWRI